MEIVAIDPGTNGGWCHATSNGILSFGVLNQKEFGCGLNGPEYLAGVKCPDVLIEMPITLPGAKPSHCMQIGFGLGILSMQYENASWVSPVKWLGDLRRHGVGVSRARDGGERKLSRQAADAGFPWLSAVVKVGKGGKTKPILHDGILDACMIAFWGLGLHLTMPRAVSVNALNMQDEAPDVAGMLVGVPMVGTGGKVHSDGLEWLLDL